MSSKHIAFCINDSYIDILPKLIESFKRFHNEWDYSFHFFVNGDISKLQWLLSDQIIHSTYYMMSDNLASDLKICWYLGKSTYYRLYIPTLIDHSIDMILYLDADIIFNGSIEKLRNQPNDNYYVSWCLESPKSWYINCGVLMINTKKRRDENISDWIINYIVENPDKIMIADQDGINNYLGQEKILYLDLNYNFNLWYSYNYSTDNAKIIHYNGKKKPRNIWCIHQSHHVVYKYISVPRYIQCCNTIIVIIAKIAYFLKYKLFS